MIHYCCSGCTDEVEATISSFTSSISPPPMTKAGQAENSPASGAKQIEYIKKREEGYRPRTNAER